MELSVTLVLCPKWLFMSYNKFLLNICFQRLLQFLFEIKISDQISPQINIITTDVSRYGVSEISKRVVQHT